MNLLILDTETTGIDPATSAVIELGCVLWSVEYACVISCYSELVEGVENPVAEINRIPANTRRLGRGYGKIVADLWALEGRADYIIAHNARFDKGFVGQHTTKPWICSMEDIEWPRSSNSQSLIAIAFAHDVGVVTAHRALADCLILARLFERCVELGFAIEAMIELALRPKKVYKAIVTYGTKELAKQNKFRWDQDRKIWHRRMVPADTAKLPFKVEEVAAEGGV